MEKTQEQLTVSLPNYPLNNLKTNIVPEYKQQLKKEKDCSLRLFHQVGLEAELML